MVVAFEHMGDAFDPDSLEDPCHAPHLRVADLGVGCGNVHEWAVEEPQDRAVAIAFELGEVAAFLEDVGELAEPLEPFFSGKARHDVRALHLGDAIEDAPEGVLVFVLQRAEYGSRDERGLAWEECFPLGRQREDVARAARTTPFLFVSEQALHHERHEVLTRRADREVAVGGELVGGSPFAAFERQEEKLPRRAEEFERGPGALCRHLYDAMVLIEVVLNQQEGIVG